MHHHPKQEMCWKRTARARVVRGINRIGSVGKGAITYGNANALQKHIPLNLSFLLPLLPHTLSHLVDQYNAFQHAAQIDSDPSIPRARAPKVDDDEVKPADAVLQKDSALTVRQVTSSVLFF